MYICVCVLHVHECDVTNTHYMCLIYTFISQFTNTVNILIHFFLLLMIEIYTQHSTCDTTITTCRIKKYKLTAMFTIDDYITESHRHSLIDCADFSNDIAF